MSRSLVVVPARAGSKGVPGKNLRFLGGIPLIAHVLQTAKKSKYAVRLVVSTEDEEIARIAEAEGAEVPFLRPKELAGDEIPLIAPVKHAMEWFDAEGWPADVVISLQATAPFTPTAALDTAIGCLHSDRSIDSAVSVAKVTKPHPFRTYAREDGGSLKPLTEFTTERFLQKQDRPDAYYFTGGLFARRRALLESWCGEGFALGREINGVLVTHEQAIDIDTPLDFLIAQAVIEHREQRATC